jgi:hypothetical protein
MASERIRTHARCPDSVSTAHAHISFALDRQRVMACLRNLGCLVDWWPGARRMVALPPGVYAAGDLAILELEREVIGVRVIAYKPERRIVLSLQRESGLLLLDLRVRDDAVGVTIDLTLEAARAPTMLAQTLQGIRLRALCRQASERLSRHLHAVAAPGGVR